MKTTHVGQTIMSIRDATGSVRRKAKFAMDRNARPAGGRTLTNTSRTRLNPVSPMHEVTRAAGVPVNGRGPYRRCCEVLAWVGAGAGGGKTTPSPKRHSQLMQSPPSVMMTRRVSPNLALTLDE